MTLNNPPKLLLINYHYIRDPIYRCPGIHPMSPEDFGEQIAWLSERYHMATPEEVESFMLRGKLLPATSVFVTLDDGLVDHWRAACEVLDPLGIKAGFFVCSRPALEGRALTVHKLHWLRAHTDTVDFTEEFFAHLPSEARPSGDEPWRGAAQRMYIYDTSQIGYLKYALNFVLPSEIVDDVTSQMLIARNMDDRAFCEQTYMKDDALRALCDHGHLVGLHGHSHTPFFRLDDQKLYGELDRNCAYLTEATGIKPRWVSYPNGRKDAVPEDRILDEVFHRYELGLGLTTYGTWNDGTENRARLHRINTNEVGSVLGSKSETGLVGAGG